MSTTVTIRPNSNTAVTQESGTVTITNPANAYDKSKATYAQFNAGNTSAVSRGHVFFNVDFSQIPSNATILSCKYGVRIRNQGSTSGSLYFDLYNNSTTALNVQISITNSNTTATDFIVQLTQSQINTLISASNPQIRVYVQRARRTSLDCRIFDLWFEIEYEVPSTGTKCKVKVNGTWVEAEVLVKVNGEWVNPSDAFVKVNGSWETVT